jgi:hypothetical protein
LAKIPDSCAHLDPKRVLRALKRVDGNVSAAARKLKVPIVDLRQMTTQSPELIDAALEAAEQALDKAEAAIYEGLRSPDATKRIQAASHILRNWPATRRWR